MCLFIILLDVCNNIYLLSQTEAIITNTVTVQNKTHICMKYFSHKYLGNNLLHLMSVANGSLCYMCIRIHIYISVAHLGKNHPSMSCMLSASVAKCTQQSLPSSQVNSNNCNNNSPLTASIFLSLMGHAEKRKP